MVGYQGWFNGEGDGANFGWAHWAKQRSKPFGPGNVTVDLGRMFRSSIPMSVRDGVENFGRTFSVMYGHSGLREVEAAH